MDLKDIKIEVPKEARTIIDTLNKAGYEAFVVGGCVRDVLLGKEPKDWDITTEALPEKVKSLFSHTIDTGLQHGTVTVLVNRLPYEVTTYRKDGEYSDSRHPDNVEFTPSIEEDLKRRDFTINALAYNDERGVVDLFDGLEDLENKVIRSVGDADKRFGEDALRIMRAIRFAAQLSFEIEPETYEAISRHANALSNISAERIRVEFEKTLLSDNPGYVNKYKERGLAEYIIKDEDVEKCFKDEVVPVYLEFDQAKGFVEEDVKYLRLSAFFYELDYEKAKSILKRLTYDNKTKNEVGKILQHKDEYIIADIKMIKRLLCKMGPESTRRLFELKRAMVKCESATAGDLRCAQVRRETMIDDAIDVLDDILASGEAYNISMLDITGNDLIGIGITDGRAIGETLERLLGKVIDEPSLNKKEELLKMAAENNL